MSRMTVLDGNLWLSLSADRQVRGQAKGAESGYPPYNIELLGDVDQPEALRITLAVAGFARDELEVSIEDGVLTVRGRQREERLRTISIAASPRASSSGLSRSPTASRSARPS